MKNLFTAAVLMILAALFITPVFAQKQKSKDDSFKEIATLTNTKKPEDLDKAYQLGKEFVVRFAKDKDDKVTHIRDFVKKYRLSAFLRGVDGGKPADAFTYGKEILADEPENTEVMLNLAYAGYTAKNEKGDKTFVDDATAYAGKSLELIEAGKVPASFAPYKDQDEAIGWLYFIEAYLSFDKDQKTAAGWIYKSLQHESPIKNDPLPYYMIASFYEDQYGKLSTALKAKVDAKTVTDAQFDAENEKVNKAIDLMLDAYARTCKRAEAIKNPNTDQWKARLAQIYKFRKKMDAGLAEFVTYINTTPLPDPAKF